MLLRGVPKYRRLGVLMNPERCGSSRQIERCILESPVVFHTEETASYHGVWYQNEGVSTVGKRRSYYFTNGRLDCEATDRDRREIQVLRGMDDM